MIKPSNPATNLLFPLSGGTSARALGSATPHIRNDSDTRPRPGGADALREPTRINSRGAEGEAAEAAAAATRRSTRLTPAAADARAAARARDGAASTGGFARAMKQAVAEQTAPPASPARPGTADDNPSAERSGDTTAADHGPGSTSAPDRLLPNPSARPATARAAKPAPAAPATPPQNPAAGWAAVDAGTPAGHGRGAGGFATPQLGGALARAAHALHGAQAAAGAPGKSDETGRTLPLPRPVPAGGRGPEGDAAPDASAAAAANALQALPYVAGPPTPAVAAATAATTAATSAATNAATAATDEAAASAANAAGAQGRPTVGLEAAGGRASAAAPALPDNGGAALAAGAATTAAAAPAAHVHGASAATTTPPAMGALRGPDGAGRPGAAALADSTSAAVAGADRTDPQRKAESRGESPGVSKGDHERHSAAAPPDADAAPSAALQAAMMPAPVPGAAAPAAATGARPTTGPAPADAALREATGTRPAPGSAAARAAAPGNDAQGAALAAAAVPASAAALSQASASLGGGAGGGNGNNSGNTSGNNSGNNNGSTPADSLRGPRGDGTTATAGPAATGPLGFASALAQATGSTTAAPAPATAWVQAPVGSTAFAAEAGYQLSVLVQGGIETAQLQLNPAEMGPVTVQIVLDGQNAQVHLAASEADTRQALEASMPELASNLREAGLTLTGGGVFEQPNRQSSNPQDAGSERGRSGPGEGRNASAGTATGGERGSEPATGARAPGAGWQRRGMVDLVA